MTSERTVEWQFGGWQGLPPWLCWLVLLLLAGGGLVLTVRLYRHTLSNLTWRQRMIFVALRGGFLLALILCLAGPARVEKTEKAYAPNRDARPLAVVVDRSPSMTVADARGSTRLDHAVRVWKQVEADAVRSFPSLRYFRFSNALTSAPDFDSAATAPDSGPDTHLFDSLDQALKDAPPGGYSGLVCLTDGLDTTDATADDLAARALQNHSPLYFAVGQNQQAASESLLVREMALPSHVLRKSRFTATILVEARTLHERDASVSLSVENRPVAQTSLHLHIGSNLIPWAVPLDAGEPGLLHLACRISDGTNQETTAAAIPVVAEDHHHILFYQGTLDWSFRFINNALQTDPSFTFTGLFSPNLNMTQVTGTAGEPTLTEMPGSSDALKPYQIVVLSNVFGDELTAAQQNAIIEYVHGGGGLLFLVSDTAMARTFSGTALESVLPVIFEAPPEDPNDDESLQQFQDMMQGVGGSNFTNEKAFADNVLNQPGANALQHFALPPNAKSSTLSALFNTGGTLQNPPQFATYAHVRGVKAGSEILAVHPEDKTDAGEPRALLVTQRFGQGHVTALLTDSLWRWRLSLPSTVHDPEIFWQQLFLKLARNQAAPAGLRFALQPFHASLGQTCDFRLDGAHGADAPVLTTVSPGGQTQNLAAQPGPEAGSWLFQLSPREPGTWRVRAQDDQGAMMETLLRVSNASHKVELSGLPPDTDGLRRLAESTGGCLLNDGVPGAWSTHGSSGPATLVSKRSHPLWNNWAVLLIGLGLYVTELVWRRRARLL